MGTSNASPTLWIDRIVLTVRDLDRVARFYRDVIGLGVVAGGSDAAQLGTGTTVLLELRREPDARPDSPRTAGLYHVAFLLPSRMDLARWLLHAVRNRWPVEGTADHHVSEAVYLRDPEGNGVEIASDRPPDAWVWVGDRLSFATDALDVQALLRDAGGAEWHGAPDGTTIGHVHLRVGAIEPAEAFYTGVLGLPLTARYPGASFFGADRYHHHLAANTWGSRDTGPRASDTAGLAGITIRVAHAAMVEQAERYAATVGIPAARRGSALSLHDPWGTSFTLIGPEA